MGWPWNRWMDGATWVVDLAGDVAEARYFAMKLVESARQVGTKLSGEVVVSQRRGTYADGVAFRRVTLQVVEGSDVPTWTQVGGALVAERRVGDAEETRVVRWDAAVGADPADHGGTAAEELLGPTRPRWPWGRWSDGAVWLVDFDSDPPNSQVAAREASVALARALERRDAARRGPIPSTYPDGAGMARAAFRLVGEPPAAGELEAATANPRRRATRYEVYR